jgi:magnesium-transporting ATPase (P-type)
LLLIQLMKKTVWYSKTSEEVLETLNTGNNGLHPDEIRNRREKYGANTLPQGTKTKLVQIIGHQVLNPLIFFLIAAAIASIVIGEGKDALFIFIVIFINTALGTYQEYNAEKSAASLQQLIKIRSQVKRNGKKEVIDSSELVPGDLVYLESGNKVPADIRLISVSNLEIDESFLTGESLPSRKITDKLPYNALVAERKNLAFAGSTVMSGRGHGVVIETGSQTQVGQIAHNVTEGKSAKSPLMQRMERFIRQITILIVVISILLAFLLRMQGMDYSAIFFFVVALAVSAIPEGLPVALTVALSIATKRMAKRNVIVRKLTSVESLGSCTVIASDKTGTLTVNQQTAKKIILHNGEEFSLTGEGYNGIGELQKNDTQVSNQERSPSLQELIRVSVLANEGSLTEQSPEWTHHGDAMDVALLGMSYKCGIIPEQLNEKFTVLQKIPYESERKFSGAFYTKENSINIGVKGAVETILDFCSLPENEKITLLEKTNAIAKEGYRILAFASGPFPNFEQKEFYANHEITDLTYLGVVCFIDPLRPEAKDAVKKCNDAGIKVIMITGDHPETARNIALELGIAKKEQPVVTGAMLLTTGGVNSKEFEHLVLQTAVFARVSPTQKLEIVDVLIRHGEFVAVTGDGVNDAPALKRANLGVAMGSGTDVAKEVGAMIVVDDNFSSIVAGVEEGRFAFDNVRKVIYLLISTGAAEVFMFIASIFAGLPLPLLAVQLLWLNLVTNGIQDVALAFEGGEPGAMKRKPRKSQEGIFDRLMIQQTLVSGLTVGIIAFGLWYYLIENVLMNEYHARDLVLLLMVFMQNFHTFNCRSERTSIFKIPLNRNYILVFGVLAAQGLHIVSMQLPFMQNILQIEPITLNEWFYVLGLAIPIIIVMELFKWFKSKSSA